MIKGYRFYINSLKNILALPILIYLLGFIYIQGAFSPFLSNEFFIGNVITILPVSLNLYLFNGIYVSIFVILPFLLWIKISVDNEVTQDFRKIVDRFFSLKVFHGRLRKAAGTTAHCLLFLLILGFITLIILIHMSMVKHEFTIWRSVLLIYVSLYCIYSCLIVIYLRLHHIVSEKAPQSSSDFINVFAITIAAFILLVTIYFHGLHNQAVKMASFNDQKSEIELTRIIKKDGSFQEYIYIDVTSDYFIGYDLISKKTIILPIDNIESINKYKSKYYGEKRLFDSNTLSKDTDAINRIVDEFYSYVLNTSISLQETRNYLSLFTDSYKESKLSMTIGILQKRLANETYRRYDRKDYLGIDQSIPEEIEQGKVYKIYVREYWKLGFFDVCFTINLDPLGNATNWKIDDVDEVSFNFTT